MTGSPKVGLSVTKMGAVTHPGSIPNEASLTRRWSRSRFRGLRCIQVLLHSGNGLADKVFHIGILDLILLLLQFFQQLRVIVTLVLQESLVELRSFHVFHFALHGLFWGLFLVLELNALLLSDLLQLLVV